jgi:signal transduction histidine kinase
MNLVSNALKFSRAGVPPQITISTKIASGFQLIEMDENKTLNTAILSPQKNYCHIEVADNGIGFNSKYKDQIFDVFQRLNNKEDYSGTGIGLAIVKKIVENHSGIIIASSELNKGATFDIYIPTT